MSGRSVALSLFVVAFVVFVVSPAQALDRAAAKRLRYEVLASGDDEAVAALRLLQDRGLLAPTEREDESVPQAPGLMADAYAEASRRDRQADCTLLVSQSMIERCLKAEVFRKSLPDRLLDLKLTLEKGWILVTGRYDGPAFINPSFKAQVYVQGAGDNRFDIRIHEAKVWGLDVTSFAGMLFESLQSSMQEQLGSFSSMEELGMQPGGFYAIRVHMAPERMLPGNLPSYAQMLDGARISNVDISGGQIRCYMRFGR